MVDNDLCSEWARNQDVYCKTWGSLMSLYRYDLKKRIENTSTWSLLQVDREGIALPEKWSHAIYVLRNSVCSTASSRQQKTLTWPSRQYETSFHYQDIFKIEKLNLQIETVKKASEETQPFW